MQKILDEAEMSANVIADYTEFFHLDQPDTELFLAALMLNLRTIRASSQPMRRVTDAVPEKANADVKKSTKKNKGTKPVKKAPVEESTVDLVPTCNGTYSLDEKSPCATCEGEEREKCLKKITTEVEKKHERVKDKFGFDVDANTGKINVLLMTGEYTKKEIIEKIGCAEGSLGVHFGNLRKRGFRLTENSKNQWKLVKPKRK